jgi:hypothetical protein
VLQQYKITCSKLVMQRSHCNPAEQLILPPPGFGLPFLKHLFFITHSALPPKS